MVKHFVGKICFFFLITTILFTIFSNVTYAVSDKQRIYDFAELLTDEEVEKLESLAEKYSHKRETDFVMITVQDSEQDMETYMDDFYDEEGLGYDQAHGNTALLGLDMSERDVVLMGFKKAETYLDPNRLTQIREKITSLLSDRDYFSAFEAYISLSAKYMKFKPGVNPENPLYNTWIQLVIAIGMAAFIVWMMARSVEPKMETTSRTYQDTERTKIIKKRDRYIRRTVTKRRKPKQNNKSGGVGGGNRGSVGRTRAGHSRSASRGKF